MDNALETVGAVERERERESRTFRDVKFFCYTAIYFLSSEFDGIGFKSEFNIITLQVANVVFFKINKNIKRLSKKLCSGEQRSPYGAIHNRHLPKWTNTCFSTDKFFICLVFLISKKWRVDYE